MFELHYGIVNSLPATQTDKRRKLNRLIEQLEVLPVVSCVEVYANEKTRLRCAGTPIEDLDLIIGCTDGPARRLNCRTSTPRGRAGARCSQARLPLNHETRPLRRVFFPLHPLNPPHSPYGPRRRLQRTRPDSRPRQPV